MARRADHTREELHDMIVATAREIIAGQGIGSLSTRAIARRIGYTPGTLYQYFKDINEIILYVNAGTMQGLVDRMAETGPACDARATIHAYADSYLDYIRANGNLWDAMFAYRRSPGHAVPDWYLGHIGDLVAMVEACFANLENVDGSTTAAQAARMVWASVHSVCSLESGGRLEMIMQSDLKTMIHELVDVHIRAYTKAR